MEGKHCCLFRLVSAYRVVMACPIRSLTVSLLLKFRLCALQALFLDVPISLELSSREGASQQVH